MEPLELPFVNAQQMREKAPDTFQAPTYEDLAGLKVGQWVKVCLDGEPGERFWTIITAIDGDMIEATVDNNLVIFDLPLGTPVRFHKHCIYQFH